MASEPPIGDRPDEIRLKKFAVKIELSPETVRRREEELPAFCESWLELKRDLLQWEQDKLLAQLSERKIP